MAFRFSLETLLHFRQSLERQQELLLLAANQHTARLRRDIKNVDGAIVAQKESQNSQLSRGLSGAELQFELLCRTALGERRKLLENELLQAEQACAIHRKSFQQARQRREIVDTLKAQQLKAHLEQELKKQQNQLDDLFLLRRTYLRRSRS